MEIFHELPLVAAVLIFILFATDGQFREIYISYLEGPSDSFSQWLLSVVSAVLAIALISAVLYLAHNALSTLRLTVVFSNHPDRKSESKLPRLQRAAAFTLAFTPWLGLAVGLFNARNFITARFCHLLNVAHVDETTLETMHQFVPNVGSPAIALAITFLGAAITFFVSIDERNRSAQWAVAVFAPILAVVLFLLFTDWFSVDGQASKLGVTFAAIVLAVAIYFWDYYLLYRRRRGSLLSRPFIRTGISLRERRQRRLVRWAFLPWLALALYFWLVKAFDPAARMLSGCADPLNPPVAILAAGRWAIFPVGICCTIALGLLVSQCLLYFGSNKRLRRGVPLIISALAFAAVALSAYFDPAYFVAVYRFIGPLATVSLELVFVISAFVVLAVLSRQSGFPALTLIVLTIIICVIFPAYVRWTALALGLIYFSFAMIALVSGRPKVAIVLVVLILAGWLDFSEFSQGSYVEQNSAPEVDDVDSIPNVRLAYLCWLDKKGVPAHRLDQQKSCGESPKVRISSNKPYAVFIIAAEGGGIYAAGATATFLAKLADVNSNFASHIFAISGVSGGAIGATVFQALDRARHADRDLPTGALGFRGPYFGEEECPYQSTVKAKKPLYDQVLQIMQDDHFSPIVGSIFPEIFNTPLRRPEALRASFEYSVFTEDESAGRELCQRFQKHWTANSAGPALILNSTWVETGFRVAFAPFRLHDLDETLYSFADTSMPNEDCQSLSDPQSCASLMTAAGVSARFPGIMPPFSVKLFEQKRWNFVDGGYSDNSGATTALDVYRALLNAAPSSAVDLRLVFITSSNVQPNLLDKSINGTVFHDTLAPIEALMKVRADLSNDAVGRACSEVYGDKMTPGSHERERNEDCVDAGRKDGKLQIVEIQDQTYGLPLGWKISHTSLAVISWMLGEAKSCKTGTTEGGSSNEPVTQEDDGRNAQLTEVILRRNTNVSCLLLSLAGQSSPH
jgi:Patatin-like phospholipase